MEINNIIKLAKELNNTESNDIIKVAGIISSIKSFFAKYFGNKKNLSESQLKANEIKETLNTLQEKIDIVKTKLDSLDFVGYELALSDLKESIKKLESKYSSLEESTREPIKEIVKNKKEEKKQKQVDLGQLQGLFSTLNNDEESSPLNYKFNELDFVKSNISNYNDLYVEDRVSKMMLHVCNTALQKHNINLTSSENMNEEIKKAVYNGNVIFIKKRHNGEPILVVSCTFNASNINSLLPSNLTRVFKVSVSKNNKFTVTVSEKSSIKESRILLLNKFIKVAEEGNHLKERVRTAVTKDQLMNAFMSAWPKVIGGTPTKEHVLMLMAQNALETGWTKSMYNYNIGNIKRLKSENKDYFMMPHTGEVINGKQVFFEPPHPATWFRSYNTLEDGVADYLSLLKRRYGSAFEAAASGNAKEFAHKLKQNKYYTASEEGYAKGLESIYNSLLSDKDNYSKSNTSNKVDQKKPEQKPQQKAEQNPEQNPGQKAEQKNVNIDEGVIEALGNFVKDLSNEFSVTAEYVPRFKSLNNNKYLISLDGNYNDCIEFSKSLCVALDESIQAVSCIKDSGNTIQLEVNLNGDNKYCLAAVSEICDVTNEMFKIANNKNIDVFIYPGFKSSYNNISFKKLANNIKYFKKS